MYINVDPGHKYHFFEHAETIVKNLWRQFIGSG